MNSGYTLKANYASGPEKPSLRVPFKRLLLQPTGRRHRRVDRVTRSHFGNTFFNRITRSLTSIIGPARLNFLGAPRIDRVGSVGEV